MNANTDFKILKIQLNFKLRWKFHLRQIEAKLINKYNVVSMIENFTWNISLIINRQKYIVIKKLMIVHNVIVWYTLSNIKNNRKKIIFKLKIIKKFFLRRMINAYKTIATKSFKIKIYISFINIHLKKLLQNSIVNINAKRSINIINTTIKRIKRNLMSKKKLKL